MITGAGVPAGLTRQADVSSDVHVECGVVVIGSGAGGATMAAEFADAGIDVVMIEEGGYYPTESFTAEAGRAQAERQAGLIPLVVEIEIASEPGLQIAPVLVSP